MQHVSVLNGGVDPAGGGGYLSPQCVGRQSFASGA